MTLTPGTRLGPNEIVAPLGADGMGEAHRAADTKLRWQVAPKFATVLSSNGLWSMGNFIALAAIVGELLAKVLNGVQRI